MIIRFVHWLSFPLKVLHNEKNKEAWRQEMTEKSPTFQFWDTVLTIKTMGLIFVRAHHEANFPFYVEFLHFLVPWFFALDHDYTTYARYLYT